MTDLLEPTSADLAAPAPAPAGFPPPPPGSGVADAGGDRRFMVLLGTLAVVAVLATVVLALLWNSAQSERDEALAQRDQALAAVDSANGDATTVEGDLVTARADLALAEAEVARLSDELEAAATSADQLAAAEAEVVDLQARITELEAANTALATRVEELQVAADTPPVAAAPFVAADHPEFVQYVAEQLSSRTGASRLSADQKQCFGGGVIGLIGLEGIGAGLNDSATNVEIDALVGAMQASAAACGIDEASIFS